MAPKDVRFNELLRPSILMHTDVLQPPIEPSRLGLWMRRCRLSLMHSTWQQEALKVNSRTKRARRSLCKVRKCVLSYLWPQSLKGPTERTVSQLLSLVGSLLKAKLTLDSGREGALSTCQGGTQWLPPLLSFDTLCPWGESLPSPGRLYSRSPKPCRSPGWARQF